MGATLGLCLLPLVNFVYPMPILYTVYPYVAIPLFSAYVAYDTQSIIANFQQGDDDHVNHAIQLFIDLKILFTQILSLLNRD